MFAQTIRVAGPALCILTAAAGSSIAAGFEILAPHRAVYDLKLKEASDRSGIQAMNGRIVYEVTGNACDGMSVRYRFVTNITSSDDSYQTDQQTATFESPDKREFTFLTKSFLDTKLESTIKGTAIRTTQGVKVELTEPQQRQVDLPSAIFISTHLIDVIEAAQRGERLLRRDVFDGSDQADEVVASSAFIGDAKVADEPFEGEDAEAIGPLKDQSGWPVTISYFKKEVGPSAEAVPVYEASFLLYANGISRDMTMRYPEYALTGQLTSLELLDPTPCDKQ
ncbi:MAG: ATP-binding protein [Alphaproteobacteria bacterium]|nr:MAG: ATP-binding protein [Alphaproteobacteria bacterium]